MQNEISVYLRGGLGNQLFQYSAGVELSDRLGVGLNFSTRYLPMITETNGPVYKWPEQLSGFNHLGKIAYDSKESNVWNWLDTRHGQLMRTVGDLFPRVPEVFLQFACETKSNLKEFSGIAKPLTINAYCAHPAYFSNSAEKVSSSILDLREPSDWYLKMAETSKKEMPIAVHIRLGDYENLRHIYGGTRIQYIRNALEIFRNRFPTCPVWVFTDDVERAKEVLSNKVYFDKIVNPPATIRPIENLLLMSQSTSLVGTNSTFSWWAAFLNHRQSTNVIFPRPLSPKTSKQELEDWLMPTWLQIGGS